MTTVQWLDAAGKTEPLLAKPGIYADPSLSPDGKRLAVEVSEGSSRDVWVYDQRRDSMTRLTFGGIYLIPIWSPNGRYVFFGSFFGRDILGPRRRGWSAAGVHYRARNSSQLNFHT